MRGAAVFLALSVVGSPAPRSEDARLPLRFAWPAGSAATVELKTERSIGGTSRSLVLRQRLHVEAAGESGDLLIRATRPRIVAINGAPYASSRRDPVGRDVARVMARILPSFTVSADGEFLDHRDTERTVRAVMEEVGLPFLPFGLSAFEEMVKGVARSDWQAWVELWRGDLLLPGEWTRSDRVVDFEGVPVAVKLIRRGLEPIGGAAHSRFQIEVEYPSPAVRSYTTGFLIDLALDAEELADDVLENREWVDEARFSPVTEIITIEMETATMRPLVVDRARSFFAVHGDHRVDGRERRTQRFQWEVASRDDPRP